MHIQDICKRTSLSKKAIHIYEEKGLIHPSKDHLGYRVYSYEDVKTLQTIKVLRSFDLSLNQIQKIIIDKDMSIFHEQKQKYLQKQYEIETSLQFLDEIESHIINGIENDDLYKDIEYVRELGSLEDEDHIEIDFQEISFIIIIFAIGFSLYRNEDAVKEFVVCSLCFISLVLYYSSSVRLFIFKMIKKLKK